MAETNPPLAPGTRIGHVHLKVAELERALALVSLPLNLASLLAELEPDQR